ncbi:MAG TPA: hypothetical protein VGQ87_00075 [Patescibacteria group bacterium]|nr:hypothetical protein [Patescibacteria group bacterium]
MGTVAARFTAIVTHFFPHWDEIVAIYLLVNFGEKLFPGISKAVIEYIDNPESVNGKELLKEGKIAVGVGGGEFDEHGRKEIVCAAELVARKLDLFRDPVVKEVIAYTRWADRNPGVAENELPNLVKRWHRAKPRNPGFVIARGFEELDMKFVDSRWFHKVMKGLETSMQRLTFPLLGTNKEVRFGIIRKNDPNSDSPYAAKAARKVGAQLVFKRQSNGNVAVLTDTRAFEDDNLRLDLSGVVVLTRKAEMAKRGVTHDLTDEQLKTEKCEPCPWIYFMRNGQTILNGSDTSSSGVEASVLTDEEWEAAIKAGTTLTPRVASAQVVVQRSNRGDSFAKLGDVMDTGHKGSAPDTAEA